MKSSVRILAIALALAFLLLARTAFQDDTTASAAAIDLKDGEASFADLLDGTQEAEYLGFDEDDGKTAQVYFYVKSEDLGTQSTASTTIMLQSGANFVTSSHRVTLPMGSAVAGTVATSTIVDALDIEYCSSDGATTTVQLTGAVGDPVPAPEISLPTGWALGPDGDLASCGRGDATAATTTDADRNAMAVTIQTDVQDEDDERAQGENHGIYEYGSDSYTKVATQLRYTHGTYGDMAGGEARPLDSVSATLVPSGSDVLTFVTNKPGGEFQDISRSLADGDMLQVDATFDIVDMYPVEDMTAPNADFKAYGSGFARAYVSSDSDSGQWVAITEVKGETNNAEGEDSPTSNLFQGVVKIVNDTSLETDSVIYAQDGDTLSLKVVSSNGKRSSSVLASATALIDSSAPTISDLSPADDSVINDDTLRISFNVNDEGSGLDFRAVDEKEVVTMVEAEKIGADGKGTGDTCVLTLEDDDIDNAGGNASRVGVLISPGGDADFSSRCPTHVDTMANSANSDGVKFNLVITSQDLAGNIAKHTTQLTIDTDEPTVEGNPGAGQGWNEDDNKAKSSQNSILVKFNESLDVDTVAVADFTVAGYTIDTAEVVGENEEDSDDNQHLNEYVLLTLTEDLSKNARPSVSVTGVSDTAGNAIETTTRTSDNNIEASINVVSFSALVAEKEEVAITFSSDEALRSTSGDNSTEASVNGTTLSVKVADDTLGGSATFKQSASAFKNSRAYGVMIQAVDVDGNTTRVGGVKVSDEDVKLGNDLVPGVSTSTVDVKLANWPPADTDFDGEFAGEVKAYVGKNVVAESVGNPDWDAGTVTLTAKAGVSAGLVEEGDTVTLKYSYVNSNQVIEVDVDEPTMTSIPADNAETDYAAGAIQFIWSEAGEYAGDSYKTVTLNEASHEGPDGESMDILDQLTTNDEKKWVLRPAEDLALGAHEFTLKATDAAGNDNTVSVTITVIERKPVEVGLSPGWNLISFRGEPASLDANDIFSSDTVSVVSQYDGRRVSPWTVWTRGSDGSLSSSPAGRTTIDPGLGLYVLSTDGSSLMVDIPGTSKDNPAEVPPSIALIPGWNLIAVIIIDRDEKKVDVDDYLPAGVWSRAFKRDNTTGALESISPLPEEETEGGGSVDAGQALWVYAAKAGVVVPK